MRNIMRKFILAAVAVLGLAVGSQPASAQDYPSRPVRVVIPFAAGAGTDLLGRIVAQELTKRLGQQFVVENKPGAAAQLGTDLVAKSQPDGYTLLWTVTDGLSVLPAVKVSIILQQNPRRLCIYCRGFADAVRCVGQRKIACEFDRRLDRLCQGQSRQAEFWECGYRQCATYGNRTNERCGRHQYGSCAI